MVKHVKTKFSDIISCGVSGSSYLHGVIVNTCRIEARVGRVAMLSTGSLSVLVFGCIKNDIPRFRQRIRIKITS